MPEADAALRIVVEAFEDAFPLRVRAYYVEGSVADRSNVSTSDLDVTVVFAGVLSEADQAVARDVVERCRPAVGIELDVDRTDEASLATGLSPQLKLGGILVAGDDIRDRFPMIPIDAWTRDRMHTSLWRVASLFGRPRCIALPLAYPDPAGEFFGYDRRTMRLADGSEVRGTRDLVRAAGWMATALIAYRAGRYVGRKRDCSLAYREHVGDGWSELIEAIDLHCHRRWQYRLPPNPEDRVLLRDICRQTLDFERYFVDLGRAFLLEELRSSDAAVQAEAIRALGFIHLVDPTIEEALHSLPPGDLQAAATATLRRYQDGPSPSK